MKRYKNIFDSICTMNNFKIAYTNATRGKKHYTDVKFIERRGINRYLRKLLRDVKNGTYEVSDYDVFDKFTGEKKVKIRIETNGRESVISTGGECLIEAIEQIRKTDYPFKTIIKVDNNGYYIFT